MTITDPPVRICMTVLLSQIQMLSGSGIMNRVDIQKKDSSD